ncbi:carbon-nitrogen hydrolase family protein [Pseudomonas asuensis]|uniref:Carbon-nitrogen hydrolase family protein n=1 Tax=Pseudomonas asuensis TaxID=1825787 RepID=A0ABQ2GNX8_9PSED|nr:carbon-nitrogen hydrolase family protein [Pseudomonas asuensis]GGM05876.1 carbon-nitrogen hydrolase family protein [Pseudomonas asuensis]
MNSTGIVIAAAQITPVAHDIQANVERHIHVVELASRHGVDFLVFPELSLTGYEREAAGRNAFSPSDPRLLPLREAAVRAGISVLAGMPLESSGKPFIAALVLSPGRDDLLYTKQYLHEGEELVFQPGSGGPMVSLKNEHIALAVCADTSRPEHAARAAQAGASLYIASALITAGGFDTDTTQLRSYAQTYGFPVLMANHVGETGGWLTIGRSTFWSAEGEVIIQGPQDGEALIVISGEGSMWQGHVVLLD